MVPDDESCAARRHKILYRLRLSCLYHQLRERFFTRLDKSLSVLLVVSATAAMGTFFKVVAFPGWADAATSVGTAALAMVQLLFDFAGKARHHAQKAADSKRLQAACARAGERWADEQCNELLAQTIEMETGEPAPMAALVAHCQNQLSIAEDGPAVQLRAYERWLMNWIDFDSATINQRNVQKVAKD